MTDNLKEKAAKGILWKFLDQGGTQLIQFIAGIYIARILSPEDYGLIGMMAIFIGISQMFIDSGLKATLIQKGTAVSQDEYNVVFYFNLLVSLIFSTIIFFSAPAISEFYSEPKLIPVARILGANLVLMALGTIQTLILEKRLNFKTITKVKLVSIFSSVLAGIVIATLGFGVWALVAMFIVESTTKTTLLWIINKWRPNISFKIKVLRELFPTGFKILLNGLLVQINQNIYSLVIGKYFSTHDVGFYSQGRKLQQRIGDFITYSIQGVMFPVQSLIKDDIQRLKKSVRKNINISVLVAFPAIVGLIVIAKSFILLFLTEKWLPSVYFLQILSISGMLFVVNSALRSYLIPLNKVTFLVRFAFSSTTVLVLLLGTSIVFKCNLKIIVTIKIIQELYNLVVLLIFSKKFINYKLKEFVSDTLQPLLFSLLMGAVVYATSFIFDSSLLALALQVSVGISSYLVLNYFFNKTTFNELKHFLLTEIRRVSA